jgi:hypothetical protein
MAVYWRHMRARLRKGRTACAAGGLALCAAFGGCGSTSGPHGGADGGFDASTDGPGGDAQNTPDVSSDAPPAADAWPDAQGDASADVSLDGAPSTADVLADAPSPPPCVEIAGNNPWADLTGAHTLQDRGQILTCAHVTSFSQSQVATSPSWLPGLGSASYGYDLYVVQYISEGTPGVAKAVTALFYLPTGGTSIAANAPIAAVDHPTSGVGPTCGPTHQSVFTDYMAVPLVGLGYAIVAPDYAGMGVDNGLTSYLIGASEAAATLDGLRALRQFHDSRFDHSQLGTDLFVVGHSQGGHAALFTHGAFDPSLGLNLLGSVAFAPGWGDIRQVVPGFNSALHLDDIGATFTSMALYTHMLYSGGPAANTWLTAGAASSYPGWLHDLCGTELSNAIEANFPTEGDLYQPTFLQAAASCPFTAPCPSFEPWSQELIAEQPGAFSSPAPALLMQGGADTLVTPEQTACIVQRLTAAGTPVQACDFPNDNHTTIVASALPAATQWMNGRRQGIVPSVCPSPLTATCNP